MVVTTLSTAETRRNSPATIADAVIALAADLRAADVGTSTSDTIEAVAATGHVGIASRPLLRAALQATLVTREDDLDVFAALFDRHFPAHAPSPAVKAPTAEQHGADAAGLPGHDLGAGAHPADTPLDERPDLVGDLAEALHTDGDDEAALARLAFAAVDAYAGIGAADGAERYFVYRVLRAVDLANLLVAAMARVYREEPAASAFERRRRRDDVRARAERFRSLVEAAVRTRLAASGVPRRDLASDSLPGRDVSCDIVGASTNELRRMREAVRPLARRLASRIGRRRRRHRHGRLDIRRTIRRSLDAGGTPLDPAFRRARPTKPQVVVLCDISGSVAEFARFTLMLLDALHAELASLRTFVFVDGVAELTPMLAAADEALDPRLLARLPAVVDGDGHSDYGRAMTRFLERHREAIGPATTVVVTGDARTNYRGSGAGALRTIAARCRKLYWLNPEPVEEWGTRDSAVGELRDVVDAMFEVRNLAQLADAVEEIV